VCAQLLKNAGQMIAIMPASFLTSSRDQMARELLQRLGTVVVTEELPRRAFRGCRAASVILAFQRRRATPTRLRPPTTQAATVGIAHLIADFVRGNVRHHEAIAEGIGRRRRFVHTTHLRASAAYPVLRRVPVGARTVRGHVVLIPRVGTVVASKVTVAYFRRSVVVSDCIFALRAATAHDALRLHRAIVAHWPIIVAEYVGTGAPHIRSDALIASLTAIGRRVRRQRSN
jgi:hypothetical protein